jgi:hypothetical protein
MSLRVNNRSNVHFNEQPRSVGGRLFGWLKTAAVVSVLFLIAVSSVQATSCFSLEKANAGQTGQKLLIDTQLCDEMEWLWLSKVANQDKNAIRTAASTCSSRKVYQMIKGEDGVAPTLTGYHCQSTPAPKRIRVPIKIND